MSGAFTETERTSAEFALNLATNLFRSARRAAEEPTQKRIDELLRIVLRAGGGGGGGEIIVSAENVPD